MTPLRETFQVAVDSDLAEETVLWRYLDTAKYLDFLHRKMLHFSRGDQFEDRFEGSFTNSLKNAIEGAYKKDMGISFHEFKKRLRERVFISCWHQSPNDSMAMWKLYGKGVFSIAVTTTVGKLRRQMAVATPRFPGSLSIRKVNYVKYWSDPKLDINPYSKVFAYKVMAYEYEKEVRAIIDRFEEDFANEMDETGMSIAVDPNRLASSIVVMPEAPEWYVELVRDISEKFGLKVRVQRSKLGFGPI